METNARPSPQNQVVDLALGALAQILAASRALWRAVEIADDHRLEAPSASYLHEAHAGTMLILRGQGGSDGLLEVVGARLVLAWPADAVQEKELGGDHSLYSAVVDGERRYGSPTMTNGGHSLWFSNVNMALGFIATMAREEAAASRAAR